MTIVTANSPDHLHSDSIPVIDLRLLSQSELNSLSLCSQKAFDLRRWDDVVIPKIDRSVFNESAGSRKQTYSRLRLAPRKPEVSAVGRGRYNPVPKPHTNPVDDPERKENKEIVSLLRELFGKDSSSSIQFKEKNLDIVSVDNEPIQQQLGLGLPMVAAAQEQPQPQVPIFGLVKRKRGRPRKDGLDIARLELIPPNPTTPPNPTNSKIRKVEKIEDYYENAPIEENVVMEIVNKNGVVVDLAALACSEDPYGPELRERSVGLTTEEELLAFMRQLKGQWGSRRKKRKVVDACDFGDALPIGWKLLLSLRRKEGRLSLYCRRYISPTGQQFVSCKDVSSYLLPFFGFQDENHLNSFRSDESDNDANKLSSGSSAGLSHNDDDTKDELMYDEASPIESISPENKKQLALVGTENLADVEIRDLLECHICNTTFDEKDDYLQHLLSSHQKTAKRSRHSNTSVCDGVIIKGGKFECQFCHKVFDERHRYNGHVGVHVRNYVRSLEIPSGGTSLQNKVKSSSVSSGVLPGSPGEASADTEKCSFPSIPSIETTKEKNVKPSSVIRVLPGNSGVEASDDIDGGSAPQTSVPKDERAMQNNINSSSLSGVLPGISVVEASDDIDKGSVPQTSVLKDERPIQNNINPSPVNGVLPGLSGMGDSAAIDKGFVPVIPVPRCETITQNNDTHVSGVLSDYQPSSVSGVLSGFFGLDASVDADKGSDTPASEPSSEMNSDSLCDEMDVDSNLDASKAKPIPELSSPHSEPNTGIYLPENFVADPNIRNLDSPQDMGSGSTPENSTCIPNFGLNADSPYSKLDIGASKIDEVLGGESSDEQGSQIEMFDSKLGRVDKTDNNNLNVDLRCWLGSSSTTDLCNNVEDDVRGTFEGNNVFQSTTDGKLGSVNKTNDDLDGDFRLCLGSGSSVHNNVVNSPNVNYQGNNFFTSTAVGTHMSGFKQGEGSFSFSFSPSGSGKTNGAEICGDELFAIGMKEPELDRGQKYGFNDQESYFGTNINQSNNDSLMESADREITLQRLVAEASSPLLQSSGCFTTLDLMPNKGQEESETFHLQKFGNMSGFDDLGFDDLEPKFGFVTGKESSSLAQEPMDLAYDSVLEDALNNSVQFEWESVLPKMNNNQQQTTTICVWCRIPFNHDAINLDMQSDSVGFMCPTCKAKISGQLSVFGQ